MAKDPAFLFYSSDFLTGTLLMPHEDRGKYITILAYMHQNGRLSEETIRLLVGNVSVMLRLKFVVDNNGNWYNERLEEEVEKRSNFVSSRKENGSKGGRPRKKPIIDLEDNSKPTHNLPEDVNENRIEDEFDIKKSELINLICDKYGFEERNIGSKRTVMAYVNTLILNQDDYDYFLDNSNAYSKYKTLSEEKWHGFENLFGTQKERFEDGALQKVNWQKKLENHLNYEKPKTKFERTAQAFKEAFNPYE